MTAFDVEVALAAGADKFSYELGPVRVAQAHETVLVRNAVLGYNETIMEIFPRITVEPGKCGGKPCIRGHRLTVEHILALLSEGATRDELLAEWGFLEAEDINAALRFASGLAAERSIAIAS